MSESQRLQGHHYQQVQVGAGARAQLGDTYHIGQVEPLSLLPSAIDAPFNSLAKQHHPTCHKDTSVDLRNQIYNWIDGEDEQCIFWLNGLAGTGKSTIARTIAHTYAEKKRLGASFFFSRGGGDVGHARKFFSSLAAQLACNVPQTRSLISNAIKEQNDIANKSLHDQWRKLIPLSRLDDSPSRAPYVFVIDALDECESEDDIQVVLHLLAEARTIHNVRLRILLTSRPETEIRYSINRIPQAERQVFVLHHIQRTIVDQDISLFLANNLEMIGDRWTLGPNWPGEEVLKQLVLLASGLFIWASTACLFIQEGRLFAHRRLDTILQGSTATAPEKHLNEIYVAVLRNSISPNYTDEEKEEVSKILKHILGSIVALISPLSTLSLSALLDVKRQGIEGALADLHAIIDIPENKTYPLRLHHPSFRDFLLSQDRSRDFWVDEKQAHQMLAFSCIRLMSKALKKDVCEMRAPGSLAIEAESSRVERFIPLEVQYACLYWVHHLQRCGFQLRDEDSIHQFLQVHLLHWLEALGWMGKTSEAILAISSLETLVAVDKSPNLYSFVHDAKRFTLYSRSSIEEAPLQLYCSALVFAPEQSIVRRNFEKCIPSWIEQMPRVEAHWNPTLQTLEGHSSSVSSVAFSHDSKQVVSGSYDHSVRLWDAATGAMLQILEGHSSAVSSVAFSHDSKQVVSGSHDRTVRLWDIITSATLQTLKGHSNYISSVAFSHNSKQVVSGSYDHSVRLWYAATGTMLQILEGHSSAVSSVAFSHDSKQVISCAGDRTARLWDVATGATLRIFKDLLSEISSVAFSPNSEQIVSGFLDWRVRLWDVATGATLQTLEGHSEYIRSVAFSPNGTQIVSGSLDWRVRLWDVATGAKLQILEGHSSLVTSVAFSHDGKQVVSGSSDRTVRLWDVVSSATPLILERLSNHLNSIVFSPNGRRVFTRSIDKKVYIWDTATGIVLQELKCNWSSFNLAFSPDGRQFVTGSIYGEVHIWDTATQTLLQGLNGHFDSIEYVAFSPDGKQVVSNSKDFVIQVRDAITGAALQEFRYHKAGLVSLAFSLNGKQVIASTSDRGMCVWDVVTGAELDILDDDADDLLNLLDPLRSGNVPPGLYAEANWIAEGNANVLWLPFDFRTGSIFFHEGCTATWDDVIAVGHESGRVSFFKFRKGPKLIEQD